MGTVSTQSGGFALSWGALRGLAAGLIAIAATPLVLAEAAGGHAGGEHAAGVRRILVAGDSAAHSLIPYLREAAAARGIEVHSAAIEGCGVIEGDLVVPPGSPAPELFIDYTVCPRTAPRLQIEKVAEHDPDLVLWMSGWETWPFRRLDGQMVEFGTFNGNLALAGAIDRAVGRLSAGGARVVFLPLPPNAYPNVYDNPPEAEDEVGKRRLAGLMDDYAGRHAGVTTVVDVADLLCPDGPPCPDQVGPGVRPRHIDGYHFGGPGAAWFAEELLDLVLAPAPIHALTLSLPVPCANAGVGDPPAHDPSRCA